MTHPVPGPETGPVHTRVVPHAAVALHDSDRGRLALREHLDVPRRARRRLDAADDRGEHAAPRQLVAQDLR